MPFSNELLAALLICALFGIVILARIIAKQIEKVSSKKIGGITFIVIAMLAAYYMIDLILTSNSIFTSIFFYFWLLILIIGIFMFWQSWIGHQKTGDNSCDSGEE